MITANIESGSIGLRQSYLEPQSLQWYRNDQTIMLTTIIFNLAPPCRSHFSCSFYWWPKIVIISERIIWYFSLSSINHEWSNWVTEESIFWKHANLKQIILENWKLSRLLKDCCFFFGNVPIVHLKTIAAFVDKSCAYLEGGRDNYGRMHVCVCRCHSLQPLGWQFGMAADGVAWWESWITAAFLISKRT